MSDHRLLPFLFLPLLDCTLRDTTLRNLPHPVFPTPPMRIVSFEVPPPL